MIIEYQKPYVLVDQAGTERDSADSYSEAWTKAWNDELRISDRFGTPLGDLGDPHTREYITLCRGQRWPEPAETDLDEPVPFWPTAKAEREAGQ
jgi:hypothetical protein